ncbi:MAG TPA: methyl-accepting chemotaxis protein [Tepidisphaeraceae bacterium]|nr:methyl-accepting chemotaxis protein [Tepidisphaeraceae bacterium]
MTIGKKIGFGFAGMVLLTISLGGFCYWKLHIIKVQTEFVSTNSLPGMKVTSAINDAIQGQETGILEHVTSNDAKVMTKVESGIAEVTPKISQMLKEYDSYVDTSEERELLNKLTTIRPKYLQARTKALELSRAHKKTEAMEVVKSEFLPIAQAYMDQVDLMVDFADKANDQAISELNSAVRSANVGLAIGVACAAVVGVFAGIMLVFSLTRVLKRNANSLADGAEQVASASSQVSSAAQSLAQGASEQAASLEETSSSLEEMSSMTKKTSDTAQQASLLSAEAKTSADKGNHSMAKMSRAINEIQKASADTAKIVKTIDEIAFQTNLLALNAAVEAARAGEAGKGFAVVAEEVRSLALRSAEAAKNTSSLIDGSLTSAKNGVTIAQEVEKTLAEIQQSVEKVNGLINEIAAASQEQSQGIGQVNQAVQQLDKVTQSNAAAAEESAASAEELNSQSQSVRLIVEELSRLVTGTSAVARAKNLPKKIPASRNLTIAKRKPPQSNEHSLAEKAIPLGDAPDSDFSEFNQKPE